MSKVEEERMWFLDRCWGRHGWSTHPWVGVKKWDSHVETLVKRGLLEQEDASIWRITDHGVKTLIDLRGDRAHPHLIEYARSRGLIDQAPDMSPDGPDPC